MILTGIEIEKEVRKGNITIDPFSIDQINPNSYNYRLGNELILLEESKQTKIVLPKKGYVLEPGRAYLSVTQEILGSKKYVTSLIGKSSLGRLGLFLQISADLGHVGSIHKWTLELVATKKLRIYPGMIIGQVSFWVTRGKLTLPQETYSSFNGVKPSLVTRCRV